MKASQYIKYTYDALLKALCNLSWLFYFQHN